MATAEEDAGPGAGGSAAAAGGGGARGKKKGTRGRGKPGAGPKSRPPLPEGAVKRLGGHGEASRMPQKKYFRQRAHCNPLSDGCFDVPAGPAAMDWRQHFPDEALGEVKFVDLGCGFGGLLVKLGELYPGKCSLGMEIRDKVSAYVMERVKALRAENPGRYRNIACLRTNSMKYFVNYFRKGQLEKIFIMFPDPHFKTKNHVRRIVSINLLTEYAFLLAPGGVVYTMTDVEELGEWMRDKLERHPWFEEYTEREYADDLVIPYLTETSEEGQKVARNGGKTHMSVFRRRAALR